MAHSFTPLRTAIPTPCPCCSTHPRQPPPRPALPPNRTFFFFNDTAPTGIYTLSLHAALPSSSRTLIRPPCRCCSTPPPRAPPRPALPPNRILPRAPPRDPSRWAI